MADTKEYLKKVGAGEFTVYPGRRGEPLTREERGGKVMEDKVIIYGKAG
jgi:hypothetical protein